MTALGRRSFTAILAMAAAHRQARAESALSAPIDADGPTLAVAGPPDGETASWAAWLQAPLASRFHKSGGLQLRYIGGRDGVTGANMFDARAVPDGQTALLLPGQASLAWLVGDRRVRFDAARLLPMLAVVGNGLVCARVSARAMAAGATIRLGCAATVAPALTVLLALDRMGARVRPVLASPDCIEAARRGEVDVVFARGLDLPGQVSALAQAGLLPVFAVGFPRRDLAATAAPGLPDLASVLAGQKEPLLSAWRAMAAASLLEAVLALPRLCPPRRIAAWRDACDAASRLPGHVRVLTGEDAGAAFGAALADPPTQLVLHQWMAERLNWRPT